ncbi:MAG: IS110 family transposase [Actinomycetota bacterium]|nr:IS110 family transposase [Actinomycetota bacterium]
MRAPRGPALGATGHERGAPPPGRPGRPGPLDALGCGHRLAPPSPRRPLRGSRRPRCPGAGGNSRARPADQGGRSTLGELCGIADRSEAELLVEVGDPRRFTKGGFARFNGTAPLPASSAEGEGRPTRHRLNRGGNRRVNAVLHRMAVTQLRCDERAQKIVAEARQRGHTKKEAMRVLKRHLSNVVYRRMMRDLTARLDAPTRDAEAA